MLGHGGFAEDGLGQRAAAGTEAFGLGMRQHLLQGPAQGGHFAHRCQESIVARPHHVRNPARCKADDGRAATQRFQHGVRQVVLQTGNDIRISGTVGGLKAVRTQAAQAMHRVAVRHGHPGIYLAEDGQVWQRTLDIIPKAAQSGPQLRPAFAGVSDARCPKQQHAGLLGQAQRLAGFRQRQRLELRGIHRDGDAADVVGPQQATATGTIGQPGAAGHDVRAKRGPVSLLALPDAV